MKHDWSGYLKKNPDWRCHRPHQHVCMSPTENPATGQTPVTKYGDEGEYKRALYELQRSITTKRTHSQRPECLHLNSMHSSGIEWKLQDQHNNVRPPWCHPSDGLNSFYIRCLIGWTPSPPQKSLSPHGHCHLGDTRKSWGLWCRLGLDQIAFTTDFEGLCGKTSQCVHWYLHLSLPLATVPRIVKSPIITPVSKRPKVIHPEWLGQWHSPQSPRRASKSWFT